VELSEGFFVPVTGLEKIEANKNIHFGKNVGTIFYFHCQFCVQVISLKRNTIMFSKPFPFMIKPVNKDNHNKINSLPLVVSN
jgi:hypothetical protein